MLFMKNGKIKAAKALVLAAVMLIGTCFTCFVPVGAAAQEQFALELSVSANEADKSLLDVVISVKDIAQELDAVEFELNFDKNLVSGIVTESGTPMDAFMTVTPMYTFVVPGAAGTEIPVSRYEQICKYEADQAKYVCRFLDLLKYDYAKEGETYRGLSEDGDLVITIQFRICDGVAVGTNIPFTLTNVKGTTTKGLNSVSGTGDTITYKVPSDDVPVTVPQITLHYPTLLLEDEVLMTVYFSVDQQIDVSKMGMLTWTYKPTNVGIDSAEAVIPGAALNANGYYRANTKPIPAKNLGDDIYFCVYAQLSDGSYAYSKVVDYSPTRFAYSQLSKASVSNASKALMVAMLNYGAEAQRFFGYKTYSLINGSLTADQKALVEAYSSSMMDSVKPADASKTAGFKYTGGYAKRYPTVSLEGALEINYYFQPSYTPDASATLLYWTEEDYNKATVLNASNATGRIVMSGTGEFSGVVGGIAAKDLDATIYVAASYSSGGVNYCTGVLPYSIGAYCVSQASGGVEKMKPLACAIAVYGYYAKAFFANV
jgi:hypothetical protein